MKKTEKRVLGLLGLILVAITTIFAAFLPGPEASATDSGTSVTDTIQVRVVGNSPAVEIVGVTDGEKVVFPDLSFTFDYADVEYASVFIDYVDDQGNKVTYTLLEDFFADYAMGTYDPPLEVDLLEDGYGYGEYTIRVEGEGFSTPTSDMIHFSFYPVTGEIDEDESSGLTYLDLNYNTSNKKIDTIKINVYDESGNLVSSMSPITVKAPGTRVELPFVENNLPTGNYKIEITAYDSAGKLLYGKPYTLYYYYEAIPVPDTGKVFGGLNISKTDYLITGLLIFFSAAGLGILFIVKGKRQRARVGRRRQ
ncbi:hypothetical protein IJJ53_02090 [Candidatus Saccharibacteria bacterium]|nr:hypothetical protein [Candidatus Saccharibacteria bacterium]